MSAASEHEPAATSATAVALLREVLACFTRDDDLPDELIPRIDAFLGQSESLAQPAAPTQADLCAQIAKNLGSSWLVIGPDGSAFQDDTPHRAANAASKHRSRMLFDPAKAAEFENLLSDVRRRNEESNACLEELFGTLNCPTCGGSGHIEDAIARMGREAQPAAPADVARDAARYRKLRHLFRRETASDRYDGARWWASFYESAGTAKDIDAAVDTALARAIDDEPRRDA